MWRCVTISIVIPNPVPTGNPRLRAEPSEADPRGRGWATERCELSATAGSEWSVVCPDDEGVYRFRRGYGGGTSGRMRLTSLKRAIYKLNNNNKVAIAA